MRPETWALVYKSWLETRGRFITGALLLTALTTWTVLRAPEVMEGFRMFQRGQEMSYAEYLWVSLYRGYLQAFWIASALMLSLGGLWREHAHGTASFMLALPATRRAASYAHFALAALETAILGFVPAFLIPLLSPLVHQQYPMRQALLFSWLMVAGGIAFFGLGVMLSHLTQREFTAPAVGVTTALIFFFVTKLPQLEALNLFDLMSGKEYLTRRTFMLLGPLPWTELMLAAATGVLMTVAAVKMVERRDF